MLTLILQEKAHREISCKNVSSHRVQRLLQLLGYQTAVCRLFPSFVAHQLWDSQHIVW